MADLKRNGLNNQRRTPQVGVYGVTEAEILADALVATLPERSVVLSTSVIIKTASGTATSTIDVEVNGTVLANEVAATAAGVVTDASGMYLATGGDVVIKAGAVAPADGALECEVLITYVELDTVNGMYTD